MAKTKMQPFMVSAVLALFLVLRSPRCRWGDGQFDFILKFVFGIVAKDEGFGLWAYAAGYFLAYLGYAPLADVLAKGWVPGVPKLQPFEVLPLSVMASTAVTYSMFTIFGWWRYLVPNRFGVRLPRWQTFLAGVATSIVLLTTTLAYVIGGAGVVLMLVAQKGIVTLLGPLIDRLFKKAIKWYSAVAVLLATSAVLVAFLGDRTAYEVTGLMVLDLVAYTTGYLIRFWAMERLGKEQGGKKEPSVKWRYLIEEQMVVTPFAVFILLGLAAFAPGEIGRQLGQGFFGVWHTPAWRWLILLGVLSQGTGIFGALVYLGGRGATYCVALNRCDSLLAGVAGKAMLSRLLHKPGVNSWQLAGAGLLLAGLVVLGFGALMERAIRRWVTELRALFQSKEQRAKRACQVKRRVRRAARRARKITRRRG